MIFYLKDLKNSTKKTSRSINSCSKLAGHKINLQKSVAFLYISKFQTEKEYRKIIPFTIVSKKYPKYLGINLTKDVKYLYKENYKPLSKEIEEDCRRWKDLPCSWIGRISCENSYITKSNLHVQCNSN
jgi:hypothetical protein